MAFDIKAEVRKIVVAMPDGVVLTQSTLYDKICDAFPRETEAMTAKQVRLWVQTALNDLRMEEVIYLKTGELYRGDAVYQKGYLSVPEPSVREIRTVETAPVKVEQPAATQGIVLDESKDKNTGSNGYKVFQKLDPRQGPTYKTLDLVEVENLMATEETMAKAAEKLGMTISQMSVRRQKDQAVSDAVDRGRMRYYNQVSTDNEEPETIKQLVCVDCGKPRSIGSAERCRACYQAKADEKKTATNGHSTKEVPMAKIEVVKQPTEQTTLAAQRTTSTEVYGGVKLHEQIQVRVEEMASWPAERITEFFDALAKVVEIPQRPIRTTITPAWPVDFEDQSIDGMPGLTMCYLVSLLHDSMEANEKEAVWTLIQYIKRIQARVEQHSPPK